jgi:hypothetical protein
LNPDNPTSHGHPCPKLLCHLFLDPCPPSSCCLPFWHISKTKHVSCRSLRVSTNKQPRFITLLACHVPRVIGSGYRFGEAHFLTDTGCCPFPWVLEIYTRHKAYIYLWSIYPPSLFLLALGRERTAQDRTGQDRTGPDQTRARINVAVPVCFIASQR